MATCWAILLTLASLSAEDASKDEAIAEEIFKRAKAHLENREDREAIREFSEIVEFFPSSSHWALSCIELSRLHLKANQTLASQRMLERLVSRQRETDQAPRPDVLLAQWDVLTQMKRFDDLLLWTRARSQEELRVLRTSSGFRQRWSVLLKEEVGTLRLRLVWIALGFRKPLEVLLQWSREDQAPLPQEIHLLVLRRGLENQDPNRVRLALDSIRSTSAVELAHQLFLEQEDPEGRWTNTWADLLLDSRRFEEALVILNQDRDDHATRVMKALLGLGQWEKALNLLRAKDPWLAPSLSFEDLQRLSLGIDGLPQAAFLWPLFLESLKGDVRALFQAQREQDPKAKTQLYRKLVETSSVYGLRAGRRLSELLFKARDLKGLEDLIGLFSTRHASAIEDLRDMKRKLDTLLELAPKAPSP